MSTWVEAEGFGGDSSGDKGADHAVGGPGFLGTWFEDQSDLERDGRKPQGVDPWGVVRQDRTEDGGLALVADGHAAVFFAVAAGVDIQGQTAGQAIEDFGHVAQHEAIFLHVALAHVLGEPGASRLLVDKIANGLNSISDAQRFVFEKLGSFLALLDQVLAGELAQGFASLVGFPHIELNHSAGDLSDLGDRFTGIEVDHIEGIEGVVGFPPA